MNQARKGDQRKREHEPQGDRGRSRAPQGDLSNLACGPPFIARGSALHSAGLRPSQRGAPPVAPPRSRLHLPSRSLSKGGVPSLRPPHAMHPPIGSELPHPFPSHQAQGKFRWKNSGGRIQVGKVCSGPSRAFVAEILRPSCNGSCRGDHRHVVRGGRRS